MKKPPPLTCRAPDRDQPKLVCGYPLPCPFHTVIIEKQRLTIPHGVAVSARPRIKQIARRLR